MTRYEFNIEKAKRENWDNFSSGDFKADMEEKFEIQDDRRLNQPGWFEHSKYFDRIWAFIRDDYNIACLHYYYSKIYKIAEAFNPHEPLDTIAKRNLLNAGRGQIYLDLDAALNKPHSTIGRAFQFDFINIRRALEEIREAENEKVSASEGSYERIFKGLTEYHLQQWLMKINAKPIKNNQPVSLQGSGRKRWWAIRNQEYWQQVEDLQLLRDYLYF